MTLVAIAWKVYQISNSPSALATVMIAMSVPHVLLLLIGGAVSDRFDRRRVMIAADSIRGAALLVLACLTFSGVIHRRWEREHPMQLWQMDVMGGVMLEDDTELKVVTGLDDHSRFCIAAGLCTRATSKAVCAVLSESFHRYGIPDEILTDIQAELSPEGPWIVRPAA